MKMLSIAKKAIREQLRRPVILILVIMTAPLFVGLYKAMSVAWTITYDVGIVNLDNGNITIDGQPMNGGAAAIAALQAAAKSDSSLHLNIVPVASREAGIQKLQGRKLTALLTFPANFSERINEHRNGVAQQAVPIELSGDLTYQNYLIATVLAGTIVDKFVQYATAKPSLLEWREQPLGNTNTRTDFELYVPGLLIMSVSMLIFQAAMLVAREIEQGTLRRLRLSRMSAFHFLGGITLTQLLLGALEVALTLYFAVLLGFRTQGSVPLAIAIGTITALSTIGVGLIVACFSKTETDAFILANFPLFLMMFFTGAMFPLPKAALITIAGYPIGFTDLLPQTHGVIALNKVFNLGLSFENVLPEFIAITVLALLYFFVGVGIFQRRQLRG
ncbi:MAG: ABC transporter permease [bacterium]|nr:ABC transporter permease [bacterium]